jgi:hypothetical protein
MAVKLRNLLTSNLPLKALSLIFGYTIWYVLGYTHSITIEKTVPLSFYATNRMWAIDAPETITVHLSGKRAHLRTLNYDELAVHIDGQTLNEGKNIVMISNETLFLPNSIKLVHYIPTTVTAHVREQVGEIKT